MKTSIFRFVSLLVLLPTLAAAQVSQASKASDKKAPASATVGFTREKATDFCTKEPRSKWLTQDEMKLLAEYRGYRIKTFKVAKGDCYEVYGFDRSGRIVEVYFNPVTSQLVRQNIAK